jgi:ADAMTS-like protein 1/3
MEHANRYSLDNLEKLEQDEPVGGLQQLRHHSHHHSLDHLKDTPFMDKSNKENIEFEWMITPWSDCSQTCGATGYKLRAAHCMVKLHNATQNVDSNLCEDAGLSIPDTYEKCNVMECPRWIASNWTACFASKCFAWHTALQKREVFCKFGNESSSTSCDETEKPVSKQECYNEHCKGVWRVEPWSEVSVWWKINLAV